MMTMGYFGEAIWALTYLYGFWAQINWELMSYALVSLFVPAFATMFVLIKKYHQKTPFYVALLIWALYEVLWVNNVLGPNISVYNRLISFAPETFAKSPFYLDSKVNWLEVIGTPFQVMLFVVAEVLSTRHIGLRTFYRTLGERYHA